ncbi:CLUMA_CG015431, isoform A [Clunio marinus]|uniref:CLUMA_CG015431, isoform A n=1 Tax=Clunio marinus TaxID=568069 RepID=A0A1J1IUC6_9DIPT|nr:CLUMA_CG015431, isoform A [Clunio marinus]
MQNDDNSNNKNNVEFDGEIEEISNLNGIYQIEDLDLSDFDETTRINRKNLMRGRDVVTRFLQIVESQHVLGGNCTAGTALNLGEGVVDRYAQDRFRVEAEVAVNRANMLTRIFKLTSPDVYENINLLHASVLSMVEFDDDIFAAGHCFDWNQYSSKKGLFCPFAHRLPPPEIASLAKDLAKEYHYLGNTSEWFFLARKNAEKVIAKNEQYIKAYHSYTDDSERHAEEVLSVKYEDGRWSKPYYDCGGGNIWMLTYTVPFFGYENGTYFFKGTSGIDIDLRRVDIDQCPQKNTVGATGVALPLNIFAGTDKCKQRTTECVPIPGLGFRRGSYKCICRRGFYYPDVKSVFKYFNGSSLEEEYAKLMQSEVSFYNDPKAFECLPCAEGCDSCEDASPCVAELNWPMRTSILILACAIIGFLPPAAVFTFRYQQVKVVKAASPALLRVIAMGAFLIYCTTIVMYPPPSLYTCVAKIWLREIGFSLTYGALMLKTWRKLNPSTENKNILIPIHVVSFMLYVLSCRISVIFRVRSAKAVKITDASLIKKLGLLCGFVSVALLIRTLVSPPDVIVGRTADNLKAFLCKTDWWDHTFTSRKAFNMCYNNLISIFHLLSFQLKSCFWHGAFVFVSSCEKLHQNSTRVASYQWQSTMNFFSLASSMFQCESFSTLLILCLQFSLFLQSPANPDLLYIIFFCHTQLTVTLLLALIFGSKVYLVFRNGGKSLEDAMHNKSSTAKFISRSQPRTYASASSVNASTGQLHYQNGESKLSDNDVVEEIKLLTKQLQNLYDRIPQRGPTTNVILTLLDICRTAQTQNTANALTLRPPTQPQEQSKNLSICDGKSSCVDKETNTSFDNLMWQNLNDNNTRVTISDSCDNDNHSDLKGKGCRNVKCCETNNTTKTINCSTSSINFDNLQLQCMCSSDNNSLEDCEIENCDNCSSKDPQTTAEVQRQVEPGSFRERLLNFTNSNTRNEANNLRKRNSELVLGTSFDTASMSVGVYKGCQNYRISCDNIFSSKSFTTASATSAVTSTRLSGLNDKNSKSNHSLSGDSDKVSKIPYSFLERPTMKLSQSEDKNLRELKIALSSTLPDANKSNNNKIQVIENLKTSYNITQQSHSLTSSSSTSSKVDKVSSSLSSSSTSDAIQKKSPCQPPQYIAKDESNKHLEMENINNQDERNEDNNKMITTDLKHTDDNKNSTSSSNANNNNLNAGNNDNSKKRKTPEGKLAIDLNDRSKFTEEVSV